MKPDLSIIIICGNEENMIFDCLKSASFAKEIILVTTSSTTPKTIKLAQKAFPKIRLTSVTQTQIDFSLWRNTGYKLATTKWILYLDADERITDALQKEIITKINSHTSITNYDIPRANYFLGQRVRYGNSYPDYVKRLFKKNSFKGYVGAIHEQPKIDGFSSALKSDFLHYTHRDLSSMFQKSLKWTSVQAETIYNSQHPPIVWWRIIRMMITKVWQRLIIQQMWRDGIVGWISVIFEMFDTSMIYSQVWELQQPKV